MAIGKDPRSADGLGGVHKVQEDRPAVPAYPDHAGDPVFVAHGARDEEAHMVADPDQIGRVVHTRPAPIDPHAEDHTPESEEGGARSPSAPYQDARIAGGAASAWEAAPADRPNNREVEYEDERPAQISGAPPRPAQEPKGAEGSSNSRETLVDPATGVPNPTPR